MIAMAFAMLVAADDEVPLVIPNLRAIGPPHVEKPIAERKLHLGVKFLGLAQGGGLTGGTAVAAEIGFRLPIAGYRLGFMVEPAFGGMFGRAGDGAASGLFVALPVLLSFHQAVGPGLLRAAAGPSFDWLSVSSTFAAEPIADRFWTLGAAAGIGYVFKLGPGGIALDVRYKLTPYVVNDTRILGHGVTFGLGYTAFLL